MTSGEESDATTRWPPQDDWPVDGPIMVGGGLEPERLIDAYRRGVFPWPVSGGNRGLWWWSPDPRGILDPKKLHVPRRLRRLIRSSGFTFTIDTAFNRVIRACATHGTRRGNTWITSPMVRAYGRLHELGTCHSVEVWRGERLAGGLYGVSMGGLFAGESMFSRVSNASKAALVWLVEGLRENGCSLVDVQLPSPHLEQFGVEAVPRREFLARLADALQRQSCWPPSGGLRGE